MPTSKTLAWLAGALLLVCAVVVYAVYERVASPGARPPVAQVTAGAQSPSARPGGSERLSPASAASASPSRVVYVVANATAARPGEGSATVAPTTVPLAGTATSIPDLPARAAASYVAPPPPVITAPNAAPQIVSMSISTSVVHSGETVSGSVETSTNVASVEARIGGYASTLHKTGAGRFSLNYRVPYVPFFLKKTYTVEIIARNTRGQAVSTTFPITVR